MARHGSGRKGLWRSPAAVGTHLRVAVDGRCRAASFAALVGLLLSQLRCLRWAWRSIHSPCCSGWRVSSRPPVSSAPTPGLLDASFAPTALPTLLPRLITVVVVAALVHGRGAFGGARADAAPPLARSARLGVVGAPLDASRAIAHFTTGLWDLLKGGAALSTPSPTDLSRRYSELVAENLGQPGFRELLLMVHDVDARRDLVFGLVREPFRRTLFPPPGGAGRASRRGVRSGRARARAPRRRARAALSVPGLTDPALLSFASDSYWRGEVHRIVDRPASLGRLLEEAAAAGAEQVIVVSASPELPGPHELGRPRLDPLGRLSEHVAAAEAARLRDAVRHVQHRFRAVYQIRPPHNPVGAFDLRGAYDERSDRSHPLSELMERGYEDAYREFIEPVVAARARILRAAAKRYSLGRSLAEPRPRQHARGKRTRGLRAVRGYPRAATAGEARGSSVSSASRSPTLLSAFNPRNPRNPRLLFYGG